MKYGSKGLHLTELAEGLRLEAYLDEGGVPTIGYGHTKGVKLGQKITKEQAEQFLIWDIQDAEANVNQYVRVPLTQNQFDACVDLAFNIGGFAFRDSTLVRKLNDLNYSGASYEFARWNKDNGKVIGGLVKRRQLETDLFNEP